MLGCSPHDPAVLWRCRGTTLPHSHIASDPTPCCIPHPQPAQPSPKSAQSPPAMARWILHLLVCAGVLGRGACPSCPPPPLPALQRTSLPMEVSRAIPMEQFGFHTSENKAAPSTLPAPARAVLSHCSFLKSICCFQRFEGAGGARSVTHSVRHGS